MFKNGIIVLMIATTMVVSSTAQDGYKVGIEFTHRWDEMDQEESNGPKHQLLRNHIAKYNQDQSDENVGGGKVYGEYNKGPVKAGGEYTWDEDANVGGPGNYPPIPPPFLDEAEENVGGGRVYGEYNKGPYKAGAEYNWDEAEENVGAAPHWTLLKWLIKADMKRCTACGGLCEKTMMDKRTKMCHCVQDARCMVDCRNGGDCLYRGNRRLSTAVKRRKLGRVSANCYFTQQRLCGYCGGSNECRMKCNKKHEKKLRKACGYRRLMHSVKNGRGRSLRRRLIEQTPAVRYMANNCKWGCRFTEKQFIKKFGRRDAMYAINNKGSINYK